MRNQSRLSPEDYLEPECPLCMNPHDRDSITPIPQQRILDKLDRYINQRDYAGAERHLLYWMDEAVRGRDQRGQLLLYNELIGHCRKTGQREKAFQYAEQALSLLDTMDYGSSINAGTTFVNVATACSAFGEQEQALELFRRARAIYESSEYTAPHLLGGLYNNMALSCQALGNYEEAFQLYDKAMELMGRVQNGVLEQAITCLNMADAVAAESGLEAGEQRISRLVDQAYELLMDRSVAHDGYYAFVCEKCVPSFSFYGFFAAADELQQEAKRIYEGA